MSVQRQHGSTVRRARDSFLATTAAVSTTSSLSLSLTEVTMVQGVDSRGKGLSNVISMVLLKRFALCSLSGSFVALTD